MKRLLLVVCLVVAARAQAAMDASRLQVALQKLNVVGSAMYVAAHPDDENTALLAYLANDRGLRTAYLSVTRGDGGQNLIGQEKGELLGVIRTQELLAARRVDRAEQLFTRAIDFGYSKSPEETLKIWGHEEILADVVWNIRKFQPDVIVSRFPTTGAGGHGQHTASAILAVEAFRAAGDPSRFPEQLKHVGVWQPRRIFWNRFSFQQIRPDDPAVAKSLRLDLGKYNPLLGRAYTEIAAESRTNHKSQGFGSAERRGSIINYFDHLDGAPAESDLFDGIDTSWSRYPGGEAVGQAMRKAADAYDPRDPQKIVPLLLDAWDALDRLAARPEWSPRANPWIEVKRRELLDAIAAAAGLSIDVSAADSSVVPGEEITVGVTVVNRSSFPFILSAVASPYGNPSIASGKRLENNVPARTDLKIKLPADSPYSQPYWLAGPPSKGAFSVPDPQLVGRPENPPSIPINVSLDDGRMHTLIFQVPAIFRWVDPVEGEKTRPVDVVPAMTANFGSGVYLFPEAAPRPVTVWLRNFGGATTANVRLRAPQGWSVTPASAPVTFQKKGDETRVTFTVTPPRGMSISQIAAEVELPNGKTSVLGMTEIAYPHIPSQRVLGDAAAKVVRVNVRKNGSRIGYVMGSGDDVADALRQIGYEVTLLTDADLERGDFAQYDAIVTGVRAYNTRNRLKSAQPKLFDYVAAGGTLVVQYNTSDDLVTDQLGPYPFKISRDRVTVEEAKVRLVDPEHPILTTPNRITESDFAGWVQERGLYFLRDWDTKYTTTLASNDPGEPEKEGGQLFARHGKGVFIYTSYAWFRQLPAGVPGAYRLFANLVSAE